MIVAQQALFRRALLNRSVLIVAALLLTCAMHYAITGYLYVNREYHGFTYRPPEPIEVATIVSLVLAVAFVLPIRLSRPSSVIVLFMFLMVYVPSVVITLCLDVPDRLTQYGPSLCALAAAFIAASLASRAPLREARSVETTPGGGFTRSIFALWIVSGGVLLYAFGSIMSLASFVDVYVQRELGAAEGLGMGYLQTYFSTVLSPALFAIGIVRRQWLPLIAGLIGCFLMYAIAAQRAVLLIPVAMLAVHFMYSGRAFRRSLAMPIVIISALISTCVFFSDSIAGTLATVFIVDRSFALPGLTFSQYHDIFGTYGYTFWSHVRGIDLLVPPPMGFVNYPDWPGLGYIVGSIFYGSRIHNVNANPFSADGLAAAGAPGVLVIGVLFAVWLYLLDRAARGWDRRYAILATVPMALLLTNAQLFTVLLSFGGAFWLLLFALYKPGARRSGDRT